MIKALYKYHVRFPVPRSNRNALVLIGDGNSGFPFFPWESHGNGNRHDADREQEWEL